MITVYLLLLVHTGLIILVDESQAGGIQREAPPRPCPCQANTLIVENNSFAKPSAAACATDCANDPACKVLFSFH